MPQIVNLNTRTNKNHLATISSSSLLPSVTLPMVYACRIFKNTFFVYGHLPQPLTGSESIAINDAAAEKPYLAAVLAKSLPNRVAMVLRSIDTQLTHLREVSITHSHGKSIWNLHYPLDENAEHFSAFLASIDAAEVSKVLLLFIKLSGIHPQILAQETFSRMCLALRQRLRELEAPLTQAYRLHPNVLYIEARLPVRDYSKARLVATNEHGLQAGIAEVLGTPKEVLEGGEAVYPVMLFLGAEMARSINQSPLSLILKDQLLPLQNTLANALGISSLISDLTSLSETQRLTIRNFITHALLDNITDESARNDLSEVIKTLQLYLPAAHTTVYDAGSPFGMNVEIAFPMEDKGIFLSGWIFDPMQRTKQLHITSDLGFSVSVNADALQYYRRADVDALYEDSPFKRQGEWGFVAFLKYPAELQKKLLGWPATYSLRVTAEDKGGLRYTVAPKAALFDAREARDRILNELPIAGQQESNAFGIIRDVVRQLQKMSLENIHIKAEYQFGTAPVRPNVSVVIPLYRSLDFLQPQIAHFANDPFMRECEVIYVLDSPEQETELHARLRDLSRLYRFPVSLYIMSKNGGYATAVNFGASRARAEHLLLLNSDVLPMQYGWLSQLWNTYKIREPYIGALAPKLVYEDGSIQHAGMYFGMDTTEHFYENMHYFKGYPAHHPEACQSREVPAVSAACVMIRTGLFQEARQLTTEYIAGDFEDSDLCLKLFSQGYRHFYDADVTLYHFERQSMNALNDQAAERYTLNVTAHHDRWSHRIKEVMQHYE